MSEIEYGVGLFLCGIGAGGSLSLLVYILGKRLIKRASPEQAEETK